MRDHGKLDIPGSLLWLGPLIEGLEEPYCLFLIY